MAIVYIGVGSNLGEREENCLRAVALLSGEGITVRKSSSLSETEPWGVTDQPRFINAVVEAETERDPADLLKALKGIEKRMGRRDARRWGPRIIDLDILLYNDLIVNEQSLRIPHPRMHEREFVLRPLAEIAPYKVHPVFAKTVQELLREITGSSQDPGRRAERRR